MEPKQCPNCGQPVSSGAAGGLCLRCLAELGADAPADAPHELMAFNAPLAQGRIHYFGDYELLEKLKPGGMGVVFRARQISLNRQVAIKLIRSELIESEDFLKRFRFEAETISQFRHPNIVQIYEAGEHEGQPYFSMEFVAGKTLADLAGRDSLPPRAAARLIMTVARAVHYVHERGVLHRDLKPTNVLLDDLGQPRVTDFGVAKRLDQLEGLTITGHILGTPAFISPEQISRKRGAVTTRSDVYSLGAMLYFLLSGRPPFAEQSVTDVLKAVLENDPPPLCRINPSLPPDLATICHQCLAKDPARRYGSAEELARDLERWLAGKPIVARPVGLLERQWMWMKRNPVVATLCAILVISIAVGGTGVLWEWRLSERNRIRAEFAMQEKLVSSLQSVEGLFTRCKSQDALALLAANVRQNPSNRVPVSRLKSALTSRSFARPMAISIEDKLPMYLAQLSPDGRYIASSDAGSRLCLWDATNGLRIGLPIDLQGSLAGLAFSANGETLMTLVIGAAPCLWNSQTGKQVTRFACDGTTAADLSQDGFRVAAGMTNGQVMVFDRRKPGYERRWAAHTANVKSVEFSLDGKFLATTSDDRTAKIWDIRNGFNLLSVIDLPAEVDSANLSPDGSRLITVGGTNPPHLWEIPSGRLMATLNGPDLSIKGAPFSPDSSRIALATYSGTCVLFDANSGKELLRYNGHSKFIFVLSFSPDGQRIVSCSRDDTAQVWDVHNGKAVIEPIFHKDMATIGMFDSSGQRLWTGSPAGGIHLWDISPRKALPLKIWTEEGVAAHSFTQDGGKLLTISDKGALRSWDPRTGLLLKTLREDATNKLEWADFDTACTKAALAGPGSNICFFNLTTRANVSVQVPAIEIAPHCFDFSSDEHKMAIASKETVFIYDAVTGHLLVSLRCKDQAAPFEQNVNLIRFSPDGSKIAASYGANNARVWAVNNGVVLADFVHQGPVYSVGFSPDGKRLLTSALDHTACIWDLTNSAEPLHTFWHHEMPTRAIFNRDGHIALIGTIGAEAVMWDTESGEQIGVTMAHSGVVHPLGFSSTGLEILTRDEAYFRRWDAQTGLPLSEPYSTDGLFVVTPSPNWEYFAASTGSAVVQVWHEAPVFTPCPDWLPALAEGISGLRFTAKGAVQPVACSEFLTLKEKLLGSADTDPWTLWAKWLLNDDVSQRNCSWDSQVTVRSYANSLLSRNRLDDLREALNLAPTNGLLLARLAQKTLEETNNPCRQAEADFLSRRAVMFAPLSAEVVKLRSEISSLLPAPGER